jgi:hypothetical protein
MRRPADVQRVRYWHGQQLRSSDLRAQRATDEELRWWHNRAVHGAYGVVDGLTVTQTASGYRVEPGLAYDGYGRELIVPCPVDVPPPCAVEVPASGLLWWTLLLAYDGGGHRRSCTGADLDAACLPAGRCPGNDEVRFFWVPRKVESDCVGVPLARYAYNGTKYTPDSFVAPKVQPLAQPRIVTGQTPRGYTGWEEWLEPVDPTVDQTRLGFQLSVDTSAAGFAVTPCYFAWLDGPREWQSLQQGGSGTVVTNWRMPYDWIVDESSGGFTLRVPLIDEFITDEKILSLQNWLIFVRCYGLYVCWMGIEERCPPPYEWCQECCE